MSLATLTKDPDDVLDYDVDFVQWLPVGDRLVSAVSTISASTATVNDTIVADGMVKVWIAGGAAGENAVVKVLATTEQGRTKDVSFRLQIRDC